MINYRHRVCWALLLIILFLGGCRKSGEPTASSQAGNSPGQPAPAALSSKERHHRSFPSGVSPLIVSITPDTIVVHDGHAQAQHYSLTYEIDHPEKGTKAYIQVYAQGVGSVQKFDVDLQPRGQIDFLLDASSLDLGLTVQFRAHCPFGDTDWYTMGSDPAEQTQSPSSQEIGSVFPPSIDKRSIARGVSVSVRIEGPQLSSACTAEAKVNDTAVELKNVRAEDKRIMAEFPGDALEGRPVATRYFEVLLVVEGAGTSAADTYNLEFAE